MADSYLKTSLDIADDKAKYDEYVKSILSDKHILSWILKYAVEEYSSFSLEEIYGFIEGQPQVGNISVIPGKTRLDKVLGMNAESNIPNEGKNTFDIIFYAVHPTNHESSQIIINLEAQKNADPGYDLVPRGIFYGARMISSQLDTVITAKDYAVRKVYSIWISMEEGRNANTIRAYSIRPVDLYGSYHGRENYDLLSVVMIRLSKKEDARSGNALHKMLTTLLSSSMSPEEKAERLEKSYGIPMSYEQKEEAKEMCNLSDLIEERGIEKGKEIGKEIGKENTLLENIRNIVETMGISPEKAMDLLKIIPTERDRLLKML